MILPSHVCSAWQCSEDALVVWVGARLFSGAHGGPWAAAATLGILYVGVCISDMVQHLWQHKPSHQMQKILVQQHLTICSRANAPYICQGELVYFRVDCCLLALSVFISVARVASILYIFP